MCKTSNVTTTQLTRPHSSRLMNCPLEIREQIYSETFEYGAVFYLVDHNDESWRKQAHITWLPLINTRPRMDYPEAETPVSVRGSLKYEEFLRTVAEITTGPCMSDFIPGIGYQLPSQPCTTLRYVCRSIRDEIDALARLLNFEALAKDVARGVLYGIPMSSAAQSFCRLSRFELHCPSGLSLGWLMNLTPQISSSIRSLVITDANFEENDTDTDDFWSHQPNFEELTPFIDVMKRSLPCLKEVATHAEDDYDAIYGCNSAKDLCSVLKDGTIDTVRLLFHAHIPDPWQDERVNMILGFEDDSSTDSDYYDSESEASMPDLESRFTLQESVTGRVDLEVDYLACGAGHDDEKEQGLGDRDGKSHAGSRAPVMLVQTGPEPFCSWPRGVWSVIKVTRKNGN